MEPLFHDKIAALKEQYQQSLPNKLIELKNLLESLKKERTHDTLTECHRKAHNLHGSSKIYGLNEIGDAAKKLENALSEWMTDSSFHDDRKITLLFDALTTSIIKTHLDAFDHTPEMSTRFSKSSKNKMIYLLDNDSAWGKSLTLQAKLYGYDIIPHSDDKTYLATITHSEPAALCINIHLMNKVIEETLANRKNTSSFPIIFTGDQDLFTLRLQSVRWQGYTYMLKPFMIEDLIKQLDYYDKMETETYRILIIDDELDAANYYSTLLASQNMKTHIITKADESESALHDFKPDLILMDLYMPECSGLELAKIIRQQQAYESIPIIFLSSEENRFKQLSAMKLGADDFIEKSIQPNFLIMTIRNRADRYKALKSMMIEDSLTGIYNHSFILQQLDMETKEAARLQKNFSIAMIDLDKFKLINDTHGHSAGDKVLRSLSLILQKRLRETDIVGRYGGEEFLIIMPNTNATQSKQRIEELKQHFSMLKFYTGDQSFSATFSAGIASYPVYTTPSALIEAADKALYTSKDKGRNRVETR